jgi:O-antigen/teichoic acid export membrane protein
LRNMLLMAGTIIFLILCFVLVPAYGLRGLAYAQVLQACLVFIGSWFTLKKLIPILPVIPYKWNRELFMEMMDYGFNFQIISISQMLYDPITKMLLAKFGGLAVTGFYEMANKMVQQFRALIVTANQVLVPTIADLQEKNQEIIQRVYKDSYRLVLYIALPIFSAIIAFAPFVSQLWIGHYESFFVVFSTLLAVGWFLNTLTAPAYFANLGIGELRWNTTGHIIIAVSNLGLGWLLGSIYGGTGVVSGWVFSLIIGSIIIPVLYHCRHKIPIIELLPGESIIVGLASISGVAISLLLYYQFNNKFNFMMVTIIVFLVFSVILFIPVWQHPMRKRLMGWVIIELFKSSSRG